MKVPAFLVKLIVGVIGVLFLFTTAGFARFPEKPIQVLCGWPVGTVNDTMDRAIAKPLSKILKQPVIVQNVPGAAGTLGRVKSEKPDGYTLFQTGLNMYSQVPHMRAVPYNPLKDFAYLAQHAGNEGYLLCRLDSPWSTFEELLLHTKNNPKLLKYGSSGGVGSSQHIMMEYLALKENLQWIHIPFNSGQETLPALLGGHVDLGAVGVGPEFEFVKTGKLRPLLGFNDKRLSFLPDLPTVVDRGYDFASTVSYIWSVPVATPKDIQNIL